MLKFLGIGMFRTGRGGAQDGCKGKRDAVTALIAHVMLQTGQGKRGIRRALLLCSRAFCSNTPLFHFPSVPIPLECLVSAAGYLFQVYIITSGLPGVINRCLPNRYIEGKERVEAQISEILIRDVLGDLSRFQKQA